MKINLDLTWKKTFSLIGLFIYLTYLVYLFEFQHDLLQEFFLGASLILVNSGLSHFTIYFISVSVILGFYGVLLAIGLTFVQGIIEKTKYEIEKEKVLKKFEKEYHIKELQEKLKRIKK